MGFGPKVIGEEAFAIQKQIEERGERHFGARVIGEGSRAKLAEPSDEAERALSRRQDNSKMGPRVTGESVEDSDLSVSMKELKAALVKNPAYFDDAFVAELERPGGPRRAMMKFLADFEADSPSPRESVIEECKRWAEIHEEEDADAEADAVRKVAKAVKADKRADKPAT